VGKSFTDVKIAVRLAVEMRNVRIPTMLVRAAVRFAVAVTKKKLDREITKVKFF
jgi:hypothetical protein